MVVANLEHCIFCKIIERKAHSTIVYEDQLSLAFLDHFPINSGHTLVVPKKHYATMQDMPEEEVGRLFAAVAKVMKGVHSATRADGINIGQSNGAAASQEVFHMHVHIIPRFSHDSKGGMTFPERKRATLAEREEMGRAIHEALRKNA